MITNTLLDKLVINQISKDVLADGSISASYEIEPLERGFGITLGNTLRRICLSHLEGTAITSIRIPGILHELTTIKGILEDTVEIVLNCRSIVFKSEMNEVTIVVATASKIGEVRAKDLQLPPGIEVLNPDALICTLTENMDFSIELTVARGRGYRLANEHDHRNQPVDVISVDSAFMPIRKFAYDIEQIRIGESSEASSQKYEKLIIEIVSNGAIDTDKAVSQAARLLLEKLSPLLIIGGEVLPVVSAPVMHMTAATSMGEGTSESGEDEFLEVGVESLNLSVRSYNCLKRANRNTIRDLLQMTTEELMSIKNFGKKSAEEVIQILADRGYYLSDDPRLNS